MSQAVGEEMLMDRDDVDLDTPIESIHYSRAALGQLQQEFLFIP